METQEKLQHVSLLRYSLSFNSIKIKDGLCQDKLWCINLRFPKSGGNKDLYDNYIIGIKFIKIGGTKKFQYLIRKQILRKI